MLGSRRRMRSLARSGSRPDVRRRRCQRSLHQLSIGAGVPRRAWMTTHRRHPQVMQTTGRVLFGLEPDTPLL